MLILILRLICGTGLLYLIYMFVLKKRVNGNLSRAFLLIGTIVCSVVAFAPLFAKPDDITVSTTYLLTLPEIAVNTTTNESNVQSERSIVGIAYSIPSIILLLIFCWNILKLARLKKTGHTVTENGITYTETTAIRFPFSFGAHIYLPLGLDTASKKLVIEHEQVHIHHYHTVDVLFFEVLKIVGWFNPFYFLLEKEVRQAHEFTADEMVLKNGTSLATYCEALLSCALVGMKVPVNYFNGSQIKTRIYMMNKKKNMRQAMVLFVAAIFMVGGISATTPNFFGVEKQPSVIVGDPDKMPEFPGGNEAMSKFIIATLNYPEAAKKEKVEGRVTVQFVVDEHGKVVNPKVLRGIGSGCDEEALRTVKLMPDWKPGEKAGKPVAVQMVLPIQFKL